MSLRVLDECFKVRCSKLSECQKDKHFEIPPGPIAKIATSRLPAGKPQGVSKHCVLGCKLCVVEQSTLNLLLCNPVGKCWISSMVGPGNDLRTYHWWKNITIHYCPFIHALLEKQLSNTLWTPLLEIICSQTLNGRNISSNYN